ncbi:hypothetical protein RN001_008057 [Aquatica leii]|uniref:Uncharacterized protein n=1 Tax=Aquatica leii TaxID=1421715 RepID=A0AAN7PCU7_9COLE|nr:hypothetical protein RN001_008057 [Aquatica leii]
MLFKFFMQVKSHLFRGQMRYKGMLTLQNAFGKHLLFTNTWTSGVLMAIGDICEQEIEFQRKNLCTRYDWGRIVHHYFYAWMDKRIPHRSVKFVTQKILLDQIIMSPVCIVLFFYSMDALEGRPSKETTVEMKEKFILTYSSQSLPLCCITPMNKKSVVQIPWLPLLNISNNRRRFN